MIWPFENDTSAIIKNMAQKSIAFDKKKNLFCISAIVVAVAMIMMSLLTVQNIIHQNQNCLLYTSDAADDGESVDLGGRRIIKKNFFKQKTAYEIMPSLVGSEMCIRDRL